MKESTYISRKETIESENYQAYRFRSTGGDAFIEVRNAKGITIFQESKENYESLAKELSEILNKIASKTCEIKEEV